jgi:peptide/nickel transport system permease protein
MNHERERSLKSLREFWWRFKKNRSAVIGLFIVTFYVLLAIFGYMIVPWDPKRTNVGPPFVPPFTNMDYLFGTDRMGKDIYSTFVAGARVSVTVGFTAAVGSAIIGIIIGSISGYMGGRVDDVLMRITEIVMVMPRLLLAITMAAFFGSNIINIIFILSVLSWPGNARQTRALFLSLREAEFVSAAKSLGESRWRIMFSEILPHALVPVIISTSMAVGSAIMSEAGLSFLGLGDPRVVSWGAMLQRAQMDMKLAWWPSFFPGLAIFTIVLGSNLLGDGLNDALNPRLKER